MTYNPDWHHQYYLAHREQKIERTKRWRKNHPEKVKEITYRYRDRNQDKCKKWTDRWAKKNPEARQAHRAINHALESGKINKSTHCEECGNSGRLQAHHWHGYKKEHWLDVQWLCAKCHYQESMKS
jgi:hypothetical protein